LAISSTLFKVDDKRITYKSRGAETQIDYLPVRMNVGVKVTDYKVIPGEACLTQHGVERVVCSDLRVEGMKRELKGRKARKR